MKRHERPQLVIAWGNSDASVRCALCGKPYLPSMGPEAFLAGNLNSHPHFGPTGLVCRVCVSKHEPHFERLFELAFQAGLYWRDPLLALVGDRRATLIPVVGMWHRLFWWEGATPPRLDMTEDCLAWAGAGGRMFLPPKRLGLTGQFRLLNACRTPEESCGWREVEYQLPTL